MRNAERVAYVANLLSRNGVVTLVALISPYRRSRERARELIGERFIEVHVSASPEECARRDPKGLYARVRAGEQIELTGISAPYEMPTQPELTLDTERESPEQSAALVIGLIGQLLADHGRD